MTSQKPSHMQHTGHQSKSEVEETEDLLFSDVDVHRLRPKAEHQAPATQEKDEDIIRRVKEKMQAQKSGQKASSTAQLSSKFASANREDSAESDGSAKEIKISVNPSRLGKVLFAALFLFFAVSFFYNPFYNMFPWNQGLSGNVVKDSSTGQGLEADASAPEEIDESEKTETAEEPKKSADGFEEIEARPLDPADTAVTKKATTEGTISLEITDFKTEIKDWGGKVTEVSFVVENTKKAFVPKILVNVYDRKTMAAYRVRRVAVAEVFQQLEPGQRLKGKMDVSKFSFTKEDFDKEKTIQLQLWDEGLTDSYNDDAQLAEALKTFTFGSN